MMYYFVFIKGLIIMCLISTICFISLSLSTAAEIQTQNESTEYPSMNKISPRQFVVNVEKKGMYNVRILFSGWDGFNQPSDENTRKKDYQKMQVLYKKVRNDLKGRILIYDFNTRSLFHEIKIPPTGETRYQDEMYIIDKYEISEGTPNFEIKKPGRYVIIPEIYSRSDELTDYTLSFRRIYNTK
ncbi:hypothetical protein [Citrobacter europaeus]|uniref:hypothetical protein n=1 Tax=Citrobacter europaeus TaxID=1914243 RepID=UPI0011239F6C|nr:hypothetical protein [Citrobacter europaeus]UBI16354.1 hypothetical protein LA337_01190 [Citrobacter europaeus]